MRSDREEALEWLETSDEEDTEQEKFSSSSSMIPWLFCVMKEASILTQIIPWYHAFRTLQNNEIEMGSMQTCSTWAFLEDPGPYLYAVSGILD